MAQSVAKVGMASIAESGVALERESIPMSVSNAEPTEYSGPGKWYTWSPADHLSPQWSVEQDSLVLEGKGSKNNIGKWAIGRIALLNHVQDIMY